MSAAAAPRLAGLGLAVTLPPRWEARIYQRPVPTAPFTAPEARASGGGALGWAGEVPRPVLHAANFPLPSGRGDYGTGALEHMGADGAFVALLQFGPDERGTALYATPGMPSPQPYDFDPAALQRRLPGQLGYQRFFTSSGHPMCLFVVVGSRDHLSPLCREVQSVLSRIEVAPA